jgi:Uma2 family endonuclease
MPVTMKTFERVALEDPEGMWELHDGCLISKADAMTLEHNDVLLTMMRELMRQLDPDEFEVRPNISRLRYSDQAAYMPDLVVIPRVTIDQARATRARRLESFDEPMALVVEVWSPSTGRLDLRAKLPRYQARGHAEIWLIHPRERTLDAWVRQPDGSYAHARHGAVDTITPAALPGVRIELGRVFPT